MTTSAQDRAREIAWQCANQRTYETRIIANALESARRDGLEEAAESLELGDATTKPRDLEFMFADEGASCADDYIRSTAEWGQEQIRALKGEK